MEYANSLEHQYITTSDQLKLYYTISAAPQPKAIIALIHGLGEHSGRYKHLNQRFIDNEISVFALDLRGHGLSEGQRGHAPSFEQLWSDIDIFLNKIRHTYPNIPLFLYGHSLGGCIVLSYLLHQKPTLAGIIATSPFISLAFLPSPIMVALGKAMCKLYPTFSQNNQLNVHDISRDENVVQAYLNDSLVHSKLSAALGVNMLKQADYIYHFKGAIDTPLYLVHGAADKITSPEGTKTFYENTSGDRTLKIWDNLFHETHNEPEQAIVFEATLNWIKTHI